MRVLGISGSVRRDSHNTQLLRTAADAFGPGVELEVWEELKAIPPYDEDDDGPTRPPAVEDLLESIRQADAVLFATPEYNHSIPGQLKNALDWVSRPLASTPMRDMPVAVVGASTGLFGAVWAQAELRKVLQAMGARVVDRELPLMQAAQRFDEQGNLHEEEWREQLAQHVRALVDAVEAPATAIAA
jgi:chromate reductase